jgi:D-glycero-D-manno-heptose 1,7-bisphosphate phosphatase
VHRAVFLDRDGVINEIVYYPDAGRIDSPFNVAQFKLLPQVGEAIALINAMGMKAVVVSNQPGIARNNFPEKTLEEIDRRMTQDLAARGAHVDAIYYCRHHPEGTNREYAVDCDCRKPRPGLLLQAAREMDIDLSASYMVGDGLTDIQAGRNAGCKTILVGRKKCDLCHVMEDMDVRPDLIVGSLMEAVRKMQDGGI